MSNLSSNFLSRVMRQIREARPHLPRNLFYFNRIEQNQAGNSANIWFLTEGCQWDKSGGCTMCNYGCGHSISNMEMVSAVRQSLSELDQKVSEILISPSGSMLDINEVPYEARVEMFSMINDFPVEYFACETRAETVTEENIRHLIDSINNKKLGIEIGLESSNPWIQQCCVNKGNTPDQFRIAAKILSKYKVECLANISLGTAFLNPKEALMDAVNSVKWALENGADVAVLFPMHIKPYTLLAWLYDKDYYKQPSLWSLVEVLYLLGPELLKRTDISWYRSGYDDESKIIASPTTCGKCVNRVLKLLDAYRIKRSMKIVIELKDIECDCKNQWKEDLNMNNTVPLPERVFKIYKKLAEDFSLAEWWQINSSGLISELSSNNTLKRGEM